MAFRFTHGAEGVAKAAQKAGQTQRDERAMERAAQIQAQKLAQEREREQREYDKALRKQDMALDLQMQERAKLWEIEKMELRSRMDFQREEQERQRKISVIDSKISQLEKERDAGRFAPDEAAYSQTLRYWQAQKEFVETGVKPPAARQEFGVAPYWMAGKEAPIGSPERQLYEAKMSQAVSPQRTGAIPSYLDPQFLQSLPKSVAEQVLMSHDIFFDSPEELDAFIGGISEPVSQPVSTQKSPYTDYPDAFLEGGVWKVIRNGKKYRIED